jgi:hypothetical protein
MIQKIETITVRTAPAPPGAGMRCETPAAAWNA